VEQRADKKRKIAESVWVHNVVTVRTGKVARQNIAIRFSVGIQEWCGYPTVKKF